MNVLNIQKILHGTFFQIEKDSSPYNALLKCQNRKIVFRNVTQAEPGRSLKSPKVRLDNNKLSDLEITTKPKHTSNNDENNKIY